MNDMCGSRCMGDYEGRPVICTLPGGHDGEHSTWSLGDHLELTWTDEHSRPAEEQA